MQQVKLNCILTKCFWCNQIYSDDTVSLIIGIGQCLLCSLCKYGFQYNPCIDLWK